MDELEQQVEAWAEATVPTEGRGGEGTTALAAEVMAGADRQARGHLASPDATDESGAPDAGDGLVVLGGADGSRRWARVLAVAAVIVVLAGAAVVLVRLTGEDEDRVTAVDPTASTSSVPDTTDPATTGTTGVPTGDVAFEVLRRGQPDGGQPYGFQIARRLGTFLPLWRAAGGRLPLPEVDFDQQVVISITIPDDACPPTLQGFVRTGSAIEPTFVEPSGGCEQPLIPKTFVVALDRATTGSRFQLFLPGQPTYGFGDQRLDVDLDATPDVRATLELDATTVEAGGTIKGTVTLENDTGRVLKASGCGSYFSVTIQNADFVQRFASTLCLQQYEFPVGRTTYPVELWASHTNCSPDGSPDLAHPRCTPAGQPPAAPPGQYLATVQQQGSIVEPPEPIEITVR